MNWTHGLRNISLNTEQWYWTETEILFPMQFVFCCDDDILVNNSKMFDEKTEQFVLESINYCNIRTHIMKLKLSLRIARKYNAVHFCKLTVIGPAFSQLTPTINVTALCLCMGMCSNWKPVFTLSYYKISGSILPIATVIMKYTVSPIRGTLTHVLSHTVIVQVTSIVIVTTRSMSI